MSVTRSKFQRHLFPGLDEFIMNSFEELPPRYTDWANVKDSDGAFEEDMTAAGLGLFVRTPESTNAAEDEFVPGFNKRYTHEDFTNGMGVTWQQQRDAKMIKIAGERAMDLGRAANQTIEILVHDLLNSGFSGGPTGPDGVSLFNTSHPFYRGGGVQSNMLDPVGPLTVTNYRLALTTFRRLFDHTGVRRLQMTPSGLIIPPEREYEANEIVTSAGRPDTANRADNVSRNKTTTYVSEHLISPNNWFMSVDKGRTKVKVWFRERFHTWDTEDERARTNWVFAAFALSYGWSDYLGWLGVNPA